MPHTHSNTHTLIDTQLILECNSFLGKSRISQKKGEKYQASRVQLCGKEELKQFKKPHTHLVVYTVYAGLVTGC